MINLSLSLKNFRNHQHTEATWGEQVNIITGPNGAGKTNLLDAIHYLCMSRSFTSSSDQYVVHQDSSTFRIQGIFKGNIRSTFEVACTYERGEGKKIWVNDSPLDRHTELIGLVPVVLVSPEDKKLTSEGPVERRSFLDALICQTSSAYLDDLIRYRKITRQRNRLLADTFHVPHHISDMLEPWNQQLVETGSQIIIKRIGVIRKFLVFLSQAHMQLTGSELKPWMRYKTLCDPDIPESQVREIYARELAKSEERELERQQTVIGPHRDDLVFFLNDMELRKFGSQGQHRIFALALKMAQLYFYSEELEDLPVFLLDDVFGDLDPQKTEIVMNMLLQHKGQSFITAAHPDKLIGVTDIGDRRIARYHVYEGKLKMEK